MKIGYLDNRLVGHMLLNQEKHSRPDQDSNPSLQLYAILTAPPVPITETSQSFPLYLEPALVLSVRSGGEQLSWHYFNFH